MIDPYECKIRALEVLAGGGTYFRRTVETKLELRALRRFLKVLRSAAGNLKIIGHREGRLSSRYARARAALEELVRKKDGDVTSIYNSFPKDKAFAEQAVHCQELDSNWTSDLSQRVIEKEGDETPIKSGKQADCGIGSLDFGSLTPPTLRPGVKAPAFVRTLDCVKDDQYFEGVCSCGACWVRPAPRCVNRTPFVAVELLPFESAARSRSDLITEISRMSMRKKTSESVKILGELEAKLQATSSDLWVGFQKALGIPFPSEAFSKADMDKAIEGCFGTLNEKGDGVFSYGQNSIPVSTQEDADRVFSLYLGRKVFPVVSVAKLNSSLLDFTNRVTDTSDLESNDEARRLIREIAKTLFHPKALSRFKKSPEHDCPVHAAGCIERTRSEGGKRAEYYAQEPRVEKTKVKPIAISSGGKVRVITEDSCYNMKYAYLNTFMSGRIRQCKWSVFGRTVSEWLESNPEFLCGDEAYVSGDLESATDLFDGKLAEEVFKVLVEIDPELNSGDFEQMCAFTTRASMEFHVEIDGKMQPMSVNQLRGQLMGSILSFPILCLVSFVAWALGSGFGKKFLATPYADRYALLVSAEGVGVNGDDVVFRGCSRGWEQGVRAVGGRVSRGKTLKSDVAFTVNSELWTRLDGHWLPPGALRPSLLLGIADGRKANPEVSWKSYQTATFLSQEAREHFDVEKRIKAHLPPKLGGIGKVRRFDLHDVLTAWNRFENCLGSQYTRPASRWSRDQIEAYKLLTKGSVRMEMSREDAKRLRVKLRYPFRGLPEWSALRAPNRNWEDEAREQLKWITDEEVRLLEDWYQHEMDLWEQQRRTVLVPVSFIKVFPDAIPAQRFDLRASLGKSQRGFGMLGTAFRGKAGRPPSLEWNDDGEDGPTYSYPILWTMDGESIDRVRDRTRKTREQKKALFANFGL